MGDSGAADQARQTPWWKRTKDERHAIYEQREAQRKATLKRRLDRADQMGTPPDQQMPTAPRPGPRLPDPGRPRTGTFGDSRHWTWDYLPHPVLWIPMAIVFIVVFVLVLVVLL